MRTLAVEASQEKRRISRYKATAVDPELKVSNGEGGGGGGVLRFVSLSLVLLISRVVPPIRSSTAASQHLYQPKSFQGN